MNSGTKILKTGRKVAGRVLIGEYPHSLDAKGRVIFPAKLRESLGDRFIVTRGLNNCLFVYGLPEWEVLTQKINALPMSKSGNLQRFLFSSASLMEADKQGRIVLPANLREYANLDREVTIIGASSRAEIWDRGRWNEMYAQLNNSDEIGSAMDELGF